MSSSSPSPVGGRSPSSDEFHRVLADYLARVERDGSAGLEEFRREHPGFASRLGRQLEWLADHLGRRKDGLPERIGPYRVLNRLGIGGMGEVFLAEQTSPLRRPVAVKVIKTGKDTEARIRRFAAEMQTLALLNHNGIAKVFEAGNDQGRPYFAMEYVPGRPITDYCAEERLDLHARLRLFVDVCRAVEHAHRQGIIHRDLKPQNILVYGPPAEPVAKIIDFGLAKVIRPDAVTTDTQSVHLVGTPDYMSPEQVDESGNAVIDTRSDVYALGVVLYELLTGMLPLSVWRFGRENVQAMIREIREHQPSSPSVRVEESSTPSETSPAAGGALSHKQLSRMLAGDLDSIVMKALAKDADERYGGVTQLADDIQRHLRHLPVSSRPATRSYVLQKFVRRHRAGVLFTAVVTLLLLASLVTIGMLTLESVQRLERGNRFGLACYVEELQVRDQLPPAARPDNLEDLQDWLAELDLVLEQRESLRAFLALSEVDGGVSAHPAGWASGRYAQVVLREVVRTTVGTLDKWTTPGAERDKMCLRIDWARNVAATTVAAHQDAWERVNREVLADWGFDLPPQVGLVPLARDPESRLQEFAMPLPGCEMPLFVNGRWVVGDNTCPVFVLLPGGTVLLGAQDDPAQPHFDPEVRPLEDPPQEVVIEPFFASAYELTNGQWRLVDPGGHCAPPDATARGTSVLYELRHPLMDIPSHWLLHVLLAWGMRLPSWQEWEYLARAGSDLPRWCGRAERDLQGCANLHDQTLSAAKDARGENDPVPWADGYKATAPIGTFAANPFRLYDVLGNVNEIATRQSGDFEFLELRGGSWQQGPAMARATSRIRWEGGPLHTVGVRPVVSVRR